MQTHIVSRLVCLAFVCMTTYALAWFSLSVCVCGTSGQGKSLEKGRGVESLKKDEFYLVETESLGKLIVTDLQTEKSMLDAVLNDVVAAFAPLAATFHLPAALLDAADGRGLVKPGLSLVVSPPLPPGCLEGNGLCRGRCPHCFQSLGWMLDAKGSATGCCEVLLGAAVVLPCVQIAAMSRRKRTGFEQNEATGALVTGFELNEAVAGSLVTDRVRPEEAAGETLTGFEQNGAASGTMTGFEQNEAGAVGPVHVAIFRPHSTVPAVRLQGAKRLHELRKCRGVHRGCRDV